MFQSYLDYLLKGNSEDKTKQKKTHNEKWNHVIFIFINREFFWQLHSIEECIRCEIVHISGIATKVATIKSANAAACIRNIHKTNDMLR